VTENSKMLETAMRCLDRALTAMNHAVELTRDHGPAVGMESIADFLNDTDGIDEEVADATPEDWLTRWQVTDVEASR
jgi:hypothetical protein